MSRRRKIHDLPVGTAIMVTTGKDQLFPGFSFGTDATKTLGSAQIVDRREWGTIVEHKGKHYVVKAEHDLRVEVLPEHHPVCGHCHELWPCRDRRIEREVARARHELADACTHCGQRINGAWSTSFDGKRFHIAKKYRGPDGAPCHLAATRADEERRAATAPASKEGR